MLRDRQAREELGALGAVVLTGSCALSGACCVPGKARQRPGAAEPAVSNPDTAVLCLRRETASLLDAGALAAGAANTTMD